MPIPLASSLAWEVWNRRDVSDEDFYGWYDARFVGNECVTVLRLNTCTRRSIA